MRIKVLYFATLRDRAGLRSEELEVPQGTSVGALKDWLAQRHGKLAPALPSALVAVNHEYAFPEKLLQEGDEVAFFPPVSGGAEPPTILHITQEPLDMNALLQQLVLPTTGAACVFSGVVRAVTGRPQQRETQYLEYEAYRPMAHAKLRQVADEIRQRWPAVEGIALVQRVGRLEPGTPTVLVVCTAAHRDTGVFEAARYGIDRLKEIVPVWKKEVGPHGEAWVEGHYIPGEEDRGP